MRACRPPDAVPPVSVRLVLGLSAGFFLLAGACSGTHPGTPTGEGGDGPRGGAGDRGEMGGRGAAGGNGGTGGRAAAGGQGGAGAPATVTLAPATTFQTVEGFGAAVAFYSNWLTGHPNRAAIYDIIFRDLGLDVLRLGNWYQNTTAAGFTDAVAIAQAAQASLGRAPRLLLSSWSPPASLKSTGVTTNGGTLIRQAQNAGAYDYAGFGRWWSSALAAYATQGLRADYISIQNEPDFTATWETCLFAATESATRAGYGPALDAVFTQIQALNPRPRILGPEAAGIANNSIRNYMAGLNAAQLDGVAHHLYSGGMVANPDSFAAPMRATATAAAGKPIFMSEYASASADMVTTAWLINAALTVEGVAAYVYWDLIWAPPAGLVTLENPFDRGSWTTTAGYIIRDNYHALRHYARWVDSGWTRVGATSNVGAVKAVAFRSPDSASLTLVLVNTDAAAHDSQLSTGDFRYGSSAVYRSSGASERTASMGALGGGALALPGRSIVTVTLSP